MGLFRWLREGNNCDKCPALWGEQWDYDGGTEYDAGCYLGREWGDIRCRLPRFIRLLAKRRGRYLQAHEYDNFEDFWKEKEAAEKVFEDAIKKLISPAVLCLKWDDGTLHECNTEKIVSSESWRVRAAYDDYLQSIKEPLRKQVKEAIIREILRPIRYIKSFICK